MSSLDPNFVIWFTTAAGALGVVMASGLLAAFLAFVIRIVKREPFESRAFIVRTAICWAVLVIASPFLGVGAILAWLDGLL